MPESQLRTTGNLNLLAQDTVRIRDSVANPFLAEAGGNLYIQGNQNIDILALNHPQTPFVSGGNLTLVSDGIVSGDAHFTSGGQFSILNLSGGAGTFISLYDPIIRSNSNVKFGSYKGIALKILAAGSIEGGDIEITGKDDSSTDTELKSGPNLVLRAGLGKDNPNVSSENVGEGNPVQGTNFNKNGNIETPGNIKITGDINTSSTKNNETGGSITLEATGNISITGNLNSSANGTSNGSNSAKGGDISLKTTGGNIQINGSTTSTSLHDDGGAITLEAKGNINTLNLDSSAQDSNAKGGNISLRTTNDNINPGNITSGIVKGGNITFTGPLFLKLVQLPSPLALT